MAVYVNFIVPSSAGPIGAVARVAERVNITVPASTTRRVQPGEMVIITNGESVPVAVAWGSSPDGATTTESGTTSAGFIIPAGLSSPPLDIPAGALINAKNA